MDLSLRGKMALVGGGSQGLGAAVANELALLGATVVVMARNEDKLKAMVSGMDKRCDQQHRYLVADSAAPGKLVAAVKALIDEGSIIHILINNTGGPKPGPLLNTSVADLSDAFSAHLLNAHLLTQLVVPGMKSAGFGRIVNLLSTSVKQPIAGLGISNTVRAAVANWAKTLAGELGPHGITINNVLPGNIKTDRLTSLFEHQASGQQTTRDEIEQRAVASIPAGRIGDVSEFGAAVAFLCTPAASYINGINLPVDGGKTGGL